MTYDCARITNPILSLEKAHVRDPAVLLHDGLAYLYFTYFDPHAHTWHIGMNTTEDFVHFSDVALISPEGYASPGNVLRVGGRWVLCTQQYRTFPHYLCLAWSDDLVHWGEPVPFFNTGSENRWNTDGRVIDPYLVEWNGTYYCYYTGSTRWGKPSGHNLIGVAASRDLATWEDLTPDAPAIGVDFDWEEPDGNENNCVIRRDGRWVMLYSASLKHQKIAWATSDDLVHWEKQGLCDVPVFPGSAARFGAPFVVEGLAPEGRTAMIYQGEAANGHMSFFLLESSDLVSGR